jgi:hypothetical protein
MKSFISKSIVLLIAVIVVLFVASCKEEVTHYPVIESITVTPDTIAVGGTAIIKLNITDADDENHVIYYSTADGSISGIGDSVLWKAPYKTGVFVTRVLVADKDGNQAVDSIRLVVVKNDTSTQITGVAAFPDGMDLNLLDSKVRLFTSKDNWVNHSVFAEVKSEGFGPIVSFRFDNVPVGTYYLDFWKDSDFGNTLNVGDYYGWYGRGDIVLPDPQSFTIEPGTTKVLQVQMWVVPAK